MEREREDVFYSLADSVVSEEKLGTFEQEPFVPQTGNPILIRDGNTRISSQVEEAMTKLVLSTITAQHERGDKHLSAALETFNERPVRKVVSSTGTNAQVTEAVLNDPRLIASTGTLVKIGTTEVH